MKKIGLYGGTFDPIHNGHLNLVIEIKERCLLDEIWIIPTHLNPLKSNQKMTSFEHRFKMAQLAFQSLSGFQVLDIERTLSLPSYTLKTLEALFLRLPEPLSRYHFYLILGEDCVADFMKWNAPEKIVELVDLLIGSRFESVKESQLPADACISASIESGWVQTPMMDISATEIRSRLFRGLTCRHLVQQSVLNYIEAQDLYKELFDPFQRT